MINPAIALLRVNHELALEFLATFSRLEYALKVTGHLQSNEGEAKADWKKFVSKIEYIFKPKNLDDFNFLFEYKLEMLGHVGNSIDWIEFNTSKTKNNLDCVILKIKQIRNNLFHGGKYAPAENSEDEKLLKASINILLEIKSALPDVNSAYDY